MKTIPKHVILSAALLCMPPPQAHAQGGVPLWTNLHNSGPANSDDEARAIVTDTSGNAIVTGGSSSDYATIKYSNAGAPLWTNYYSGPASIDGATAVAVDSNGNVFVTGSSSATNGGAYNINLDYGTVAYSSAGTPLWTNRYNGPGNSDDEGRAIVTDSSGNVFVTGSSRSGTVPSSSAFATVAYSNSGLPLWTNRFGSGTDYDIATAIAVDSSGNVFITGNSAVGIGTAIKYSNAGVPLWTNRFYGAGRAVAVARSSGNVFVTGSPGTIAYSNGGTPLWTNLYDGATALALDSSGNVFVTGYSPGTNLYSDYVTAAYSSTGVPLWTNRCTSGKYGAQASSIAIDSSGNVFVTGVATPAAGEDDYATVAYSSAGVPLWTNLHKGPLYNGYSSARASSVAVDGGGNVFVTGSSTVTGSNYEWATIKYSLSIRPYLSIQELSNQTVLTWTSSAFTLQSAPAPTATFTTISNATSPYTNPITGPQQFFRLTSP